MTVPNVVLLTGGTGSFGHAYTSYLLSTDVERIRILSRDEAKQAAMRATYADERLRFLVGDVRDRDRLYRAMQEVDLVIHAAALKRVEVAEYDSAECAKTNVLGTMNVIDAATDANVKQVVLLSTDKACAPVNAYGASKLLAEKLMLAAENARGNWGPHFAVTRYGNVAGSRGSVIPTWRVAKARGEPLVVTAPEATRFWMTLREAVELVRWVVANMRGGELVVPELPAYRLGDLARAIGGEIQISHPRPGEKEHEAMIGPDESGQFVRVGGYFVRGGGWTGSHLYTPLASDRAQRLTVEELGYLLEEVT